MELEDGRGIVEPSDEDDITHPVSIETICIGNDQLVAFSFSYLIHQQSTWVFILTAVSNNGTIFEPNKIIIMQYICTEYNNFSVTG